MASEKIEISQLELAEDLAGDMVFPVENSAETKATTLQIFKDWLNKFFMNKTSDEDVGGIKKFISGNTQFKYNENGNCRFIGLNERYGVVVEVDETKLHIKLTDKDDPYGKVNNLKPFRIDLETGAVGCEANKELKSGWWTNSVLVVDKQYQSGSSGYVKLGTGVLIQWGRATGGTTTFPIPFTSGSSYSLGVGYNEASASDHMHGGVNNLTSTGFKWVAYGGSSIECWIAIGY